MRFNLGLRQHRWIEVTPVGDMLVIVGGEGLSITPVAFDRVTLEVAR